MNRLSRGCLIALTLSGYCMQAWSEERSISLMPPIKRYVDRTSQGDFVSTSDQDGSASSVENAVYDPALTGGVRPRGSKLPRAMGQSSAPVQTTVQEVVPRSELMPHQERYESAPTIPTLEIPIPSISLPDVENLWATGAMIPGDVEDPTWIFTEYLVWGMRAAKMPAIVTTSFNVDSLGRLDQPDTRVLFGEDVSLPWKQGFRFHIGSWFEPTETLGIDGSYMVLFNRSRFYESGGQADTLTARPFFNVLTGKADSGPIVTPPSATNPNIIPTGGGIIVDMPSRFQSVEVNAISNYRRGMDGRIDWFAGFRYFNLTEGLSIYEALYVDDPAAQLAGTTFAFQDSFDTRNYIYTAQVGARLVSRRGCFSYTITGRLGMGWSHQAARIDGGTMIWDRVTFPQIYQGGFLTQASSTGNYNQDKFIFTPEIGFKVSYELADHVNVSLGYSLIFLSSVLRPGDLIDTRLNPNFLAPAEGSLAPHLPQPVFKDSTFWTHGATFGFDFHY